MVPVVAVVPEVVVEVVPEVDVAVVAVVADVSVIVPLGMAEVLVVALVSVDIAAVDEVSVAIVADVSVETALVSVLLFVSLLQAKPKTLSARTTKRTRSFLLMLFFSSRILFVVWIELEFE